MGLMTRRATARRWATLALLLGAAIGAGCAGPVWAAASALEVLYGSPSTYLLPEINGMGGTGTALYRGGVSNVLNPAFLVLEQTTRIDAALAVAEVREDRLMPLYDTFESFVTDIAIASNRHHHFASGFGLAHRLGTTPATAALSLTERYDFSYDFTEEVRDPDPFASPRDQILQDREVAIDGAIRALSGGLGVALHPAVSLGLALHYAFGTRGEVLSQRFYLDPESNFNYDAELDLDGLNFTLGLRIQPSERLELGLAYESPLEVDGDLTGTVYEGASPAAGSPVLDDVTIRYPRRYRAGATYRPRAEPQTVFSVEGIYSEWSDVHDTRQAATEPLVAPPVDVAGGPAALPLEDTVDVRIGVEHIFYNGMAARFGFRHLDSYADREAGTSFFTGGVGMPLVGGQLGASVEVSKTAFYQGHWFSYPDFEISGRPLLSDDQSRVENTQFRFGMGFRRAF
jgi:hypothetical protein